MAALDALALRPAAEDQQREREQPRLIGVATHDDGAAAVDRVDILPCDASAGRQRPQLLPEAAGFAFADERQRIEAQQTVGGRMVHEVRIADRLQDPTVAIYRDEQVRCGECEIAILIAIMRRQRHWRYIQSTDIDGKYRRSGN